MTERLSARGRPAIALASVLAWVLFLTAANVHGQVPFGQTRPPANRLFGSVGLGFMSIEQGVGVALPVGFTLLLERQRLLATARIAELGLLEGQDRDPRYYRPYIGSAYCVDSSTGQYVPSYYCSGGTDFLLSGAVEASFVVFNEVWIADKPGKVAFGGGYRFSDPATPYAKAGFYFTSGAMSLGGASLTIGSDYVGMGIEWGFDLMDLARRF